ncbi:AMP-binding enzyme [Streptomyces malaysiensis]|uniref:AMP-dependent synthetase and ligase n=1 Tax=Streptomyces malaysiensis TaxID=92644 RepID=A0A7X5X197_STRMQ|nr:AMP-dependent synthetase and ligase [Streptomyces malaysiensis]
MLPGTRVRVGGGPDGRESGEGELWVSGPGVMAGFHGGPDATAEVLRDGWFRTGDLARIDASGELVITGRMSDLIIRGGVNIHPSEVEAVLRRFPGVADAAVARRPHPVFGEVPVGYLVAGPGGAVLDRGRVLAACRAELSGFKVPVELFEVADIPRTASGKILRRDLAGLPARALGAEVAGRPPEDLLTLVRSEVAAVLGGTPRAVEPNTALRDLGMDSLTATVLRERLSAVTGLPLSEAVAFDFPTAAALAAHLGERNAAGPAAAGPVIRSATRARRAGTGSAGRWRLLPPASGAGCRSRWSGPWRPASSATRRRRARSTRTPCWRSWGWTPWPRSICAMSSRRGRG